MNARLKEHEPRTSLLAALSKEAAQIARTLELLADNDCRAPKLVVVDALFIKRMIKLRQERTRHFPAEMFADPAWDMMLDLAAARLDGRSVSASSLCIAAQVPATTALRWIRLMTEAGIFQRSYDPNDRRRIWISLSEPAYEKVLTIIAQAAVAFS